MCPSSPPLRDEVPSTVRAAPRWWRAGTSAKNRKPNTTPHQRDVGDGRQPFGLDAGDVGQHGMGDDADGAEEGELANGESVGVVPQTAGSARTGPGRGSGTG